MRHKTDILTLTRWAHRDKIQVEEFNKALLNKEPVMINGYYWALSSREQINKDKFEYTFIKPCQTLNEWDLQHKPAPKVNEMQDKPKQPDIVYIAGAISGDVVANRHRFFVAKHSIMASSTNATVLTPADLPVGLTESQYMSICLPMVMMSTSLFMLKGWEKSEGAVAEHALAQKLKIEIVYQGEHDGKL